MILPNDHLNKRITAYYKFDYTTFGTSGNPDFLNLLKNQFRNTNPKVLYSAKKKLKSVLLLDLPEIWEDLYDEVNTFTVCVIPRAKADIYYTENQKLFRTAVSEAINDLNETYDYSSIFIDGTDFIRRHTNTRTTHMNKSGHGGDGEMPYVGITNDTCYISKKIKAKDILLIDDIYTRDVNIDEDAIQALLDHGAKSVTFYAVAKTLKGASKNHGIKNKFIQLSPSLRDTYEILENEDDLNVIAIIRGLKKETIVNHIVQIGKILGNASINKFRPKQVIIEMVKKAVFKVGGMDRLKPIYEELEGEMSYDEIKLALSFIK